MLKSDSVAIHK